MGFIAVLFVLLFIPSLGHGAAVIYDTSNLSVGFGTVVTTSPGNQIGNEVTLAGSERVVTEFTGYYQGFVPIEGTTLVGTPTAIVRFFANDGPDNGGVATPHTLLFQSDPMTILSGSVGIQSLTLNHLAILVPDTFTWTMQFTGIDGGYNLAGGLAPVVGTVTGSEARTWIGPGTPDLSCFAGCWSPFSGSSNYVFEATISARNGNPPAVPEPSTLTLLSVGLISLMYAFCLGPMGH